MKSLWEILHAVIGFENKSQEFSLPSLMFSTLELMPPQISMIFKL